MDRRGFIKNSTLTTGAILASSAIASTAAAASSKKNGIKTKLPFRKNDPFMSPENSALILIDYQAHILAGVNTMDHAKMISNTQAAVKSAKLFNIPIILSTVGVELSGAPEFIEEVTSLVPDAPVIDRTNVNAWEDEEFVQVVTGLGRKKLIMGGLWTEVCLAYPAIEASTNGFEVLALEDCVGGANEISHKAGLQRMFNAGVTPVTWNVMLAELHRDHARKETSPGLMAIFKEHLYS
jgi:nicotinamidase-related amidase